MASTEKATEARNEFFQKLKPCCVQISQLALRGSDTSPSSRELLRLTSQLHTLLNDQVQLNPLALDEKLAEYVFFPLYHIFRQLDSFPMNLIENCVKCLTTLILHGWKSSISPKLVQQILSLLTFIIDGVPGSQKKREVPEETVLESFEALLALFTTARSSAASTSELSKAENIPALGHAITVMVDGANDGETPAIQQAALRTIQAVFEAIKDHKTLANFLPGTVSGITKLLSAASRHKNIVLVEGLQSIQTILIRVLGDLQTRSIVSKAKEDDSAESTKADLLSPAWLEATTKQVEKAIATIIKLRTKDEAEVQSALSRLCVTLLDECHKTLANCTNMLVETAMILEEQSEEVSLTKTSLRDLISIYPELGDAAKDAVYSWLSSFPRVMQSGDETVKINALHALTKGITLLKGLGMESTVLEHSLSSTLQDSLVTLARSTKSKQIQPTSTVQLLEDRNTLAVTSVGTKFAPIMLPQESQRKTLAEVFNLLKAVASWNDQTNIVENMLESAIESVGEPQIASFWLCFELVKAVQQSNTDFDAFVDMSSIVTETTNVEAILDELYSFSVQILDSNAELDDENGWRLEAIALEVTSYAAERAKEAFRPELIDVLFPIATYLGSENQFLQQHAVVTLNSVALSCGYSNVSTMIIDNVDYMVNSVALRLNSLDMSPASTRVLLMMMKLTGPRLIPYLDDVIDSIFGALDNYHGYPAFVEDLFSVLKEAVTQGAQSSTLLLEDQKHKTIDHRKKQQLNPDLQTLLDVIRRRKEQKKRDEEEIEEVIPLKGHPTIPWKTKKDGDDDDEEDGAGAEREPEKKPNSPTYQLLLRIANLTQYYLTSPTPRLRRSLLELLKSASTALAADEESFLPLVNAIWPVLITRIYDSEPYITIEACTTLAEFCSSAGDFLSSRFKTEWSESLRKWCHKVKKEATGNNFSRSQYQLLQKNSGPQDSGLLIPIRSVDGIGSLSKSVGGNSSLSVSSGSLGQFASPVKIWDAAVKLLTAMVGHVRMDEEIFDEILDLLSDVMERDDAVREALETINADAVWLVRYEKGLVEKWPTPQIDGIKLVDM